MIHFFWFVPHRTLIIHTSGQMSIPGDRNGSLQDAKIAENLEQDLEEHYSGENPEENVADENPDDSLGGINDRRRRMMQLLRRLWIPLKVAKKES